MFESDECAADGVLLVMGAVYMSAHQPAHVHMPRPKYTGEELFQLLHGRWMHPATSVLAATCDPAITVGHDFQNIPKRDIVNVCKKGCQICTSFFMVQRPKGGPTERPADAPPVGVLDSFGPVAEPAVYFGYRYANNVIHAASGVVVTEGSVPYDPQTNGAAASPASIKRRERTPAWISKIGRRPDFL